MTKILFLDIDGVVNKQENFNPAHKPRWPIDRYCAFLVGKIQLETDCLVVLSSSWRHHKEAVEEVKSNVVDIISTTPTLKSGFRGDEIKRWLESFKSHFPVEKYAILDDDSDFYDDQPLFKTTFKDGLTDEIAQKVIDYLNKD